MKNPARLLDQPGFGRLDPALVSVTAALVSIGLVMVYSASVAVAVETEHNQMYFFMRQVLFFAIGLAALVGLSRLPYQRLASAGKPLYAGGVLLLLLVLILGHRVGGAQRWVAAGPLGQLQPSELMKVALIVVLSAIFARDTRQVRGFRRGFLVASFLVAVPVVLVIAEPDLGTGVILAATGFAVYFAAGACLLQLPLLLVGTGGLLPVLIVVAPYRFNRFLTFLHPLDVQNAQGTSYQVQQALIALGSGGLFGRGLGASRQKFSYLPAPHTDSIFAVVGEELGYLGCLAVIILFLAMAWRGLAIARESPDQFGALLATGITCSLVIQAFINIAAVSSSIPFTGVPLPFISYGGSSLIVSLAGVGILLNIGVQRQPSAVAAADRPAVRKAASRPVGLAPVHPAPPRPRPADRPTAVSSRRSYGG